MKAKIMNHIFSLFLAENQMPIIFQKELQTTKGIITLTNKTVFIGGLYNSYQLQLIALSMN
jgi:hypothetical protein